MDVFVYKFPRLVLENYVEIEHVFNELYTRHRDAHSLDEIELDWMDTANNWLISVSTYVSNNES